MNLCWKARLYTNEHTSLAGNQEPRGRFRQHGYTCIARNCACPDLLMLSKSKDACSYPWNSSMDGKVPGLTITSNSVPKRFAWKTCNQINLPSLMGTFTTWVRGGGYGLISTRNCEQRHWLQSPRLSRWLRSRSRHHHSMENW